MSVLKTFVKHMAGSDLYVALIERGLFGEGAAEVVFSGKAYTVVKQWELISKAYSSLMENFDAEINDIFSWKQPLGSAQ